MVFDYVIVGGSAAGVAAASAVEQAHPGAKILLVDRGIDMPHDKPSLSKQLLRREAEDHTALLRSVESWEGSDIELRMSTAAVGIDPDGTVRLSSGESVKGRATVLATGCVPRTLELFAGAGNAVSLRTLADLRVLREQVSSSAHVVLVGGGFIGLEVASSLVDYVASVTVIEAGGRPLERIIGEAAATYMAAWPAAAGVDVRTKTSVTSVTKDAGGSVTFVELSDGQVLPADLVVVGVGVTVDLDWLEDGPIELGDGMVVDEHLQTSLPGVFAAGDAVQFPDLRTGRRVRVEHWTTAVEQGKTAGLNAAHHVLGEPLVTFDAVPYVWSDQYGHKVQMAGYTRWADESRVVQESPERLFVEYYENAQLCAVLGVDAPREVMMARRALAKTRTATPTP